MSRENIYYWKCDRPAAFHGTQEARHGAAEIEPQLSEELKRHFATRDCVISPGSGQGNHLTWCAEVAGKSMFVRVENGPEGDDNLTMESAVMGAVREVGVRTPIVHGLDASRSRVPFAWQALERFETPDLNHWFKRGELDQESVAFQIGVSVAKWQNIRPTGYGPLDPLPWACDGNFVGYHSCYRDYFWLRLDEHLLFLVARQFLSRDEAEEMRSEILLHDSLLKLDGGCLVHKDLALWNILGSADHIDAFIDFDDSVSGDPMDDLSLLGCFHDQAFLRRAIEGYESVRTLPPEHARRFWLHLLRNMIVKAVIRVGAGYFDRSDGFFLISAGSNGQSLRETTSEKIKTALRGLRRAEGL